MSLGEPMSLPDQARRTAQRLQPFAVAKSPGRAERPFLRRAFCLALALAGNSTRAAIFNMDRRPKKIALNVYKDVLER
jgi:hypothetical protein